MFSEIIPIKLISSSPQVTTKTNENVQMECIFDGYPIKPVKWFKDDKEIGSQVCSPFINSYQICGKDESSKYKTEFKAIEAFKRFKSMLVIRRTAYPSDHGMYHCQAGENDQIKKGNIFVDVHGKWSKILIAVNQM